MNRVMGGAISKWKGSWAMLQANEESHGGAASKMKRVMGGAISDGRGLRCYKQMKRVTGGAIS